MFQTNPVSLIVLFVGLSLLPFVAMIATSYLKIVIVMSLIRNALGIQSIPPNMVVNALAMILTFFIMAPIMQESWQTLNENQQARAQNGQVANQPAAGQNLNMLGLETDALAKAAEPFRVWLSNHTADRERAFFITLDYAQLVCLKSLGHL